MPNQLTLAQFLAKFRGLSTTEDKAKLERLLMLTELHPLTVVWQVGGHRSWPQFLRNEQLCPAPYLTSFEEALGLFSRPTIMRIGTDAAVTLARIEPHLRDLTLKKIDAYIDQHKTRPRYPTVYGFVRTLRKTIDVVSIRSKGRASTKYVTRH